ncbi:MAG: MBL fold metallo-hydrolase [Patescibacteria group bacterium]
MSEIKILIAGYARPIKGGYLASPSTVLIKDSGKLILVDPGANAGLLLRALKKEKIKPADIGIIFLTHYHPDHILNIRLFPKADIYDSDTIYRGDQEIFYNGKNIPGTAIKIIATPGHAHEHASLIAKTKEGVYAIAGDVFWWDDREKPKMDKQSLLNLKDEFAKDKKALRQSRLKLLKIADYIIPGHGVKFQVTS